MSTTLQHLTKGWSAALLLTLSLGQLGCAGILDSLARSSRSKPDKAEEEAKYEGPECEHHSWNMDNPGDQVLARVCDQPGFASRSQAMRDVGKHHRGFDDRHPKMLVAAFTVVDCARSCAESPLEMGVSSYYASILDREKLVAELTRIGDVPAAMRDFFVERAMASKSKVTAAAGALDARRHRMYVETVREVVKARNDYFAEHAAAYRQLDALEAKADGARAKGQAPADVVNGLVSLRADYLAKCADDECRFDPFVIEVTRQLVLLHIAADQALLARAENTLLSEKSAGRHLFSVETGTAIYVAMQEERHDADLYKSAKASGMDAETLRARFGDPPPLPVDPDGGFIGSEQLPDLTKVLDGAKKARIEGGLVAAVTPLPGDGEALARVSFQPNVSQHPVMSCHRTSRVKAVRWEGRRAVLEYESVCTKVGERTDVRKFEPVVVPASEVGALRPGEYLQALVEEDHRGLVVRSFEPQEKETKTPTRVLQVRGARIGG